MQQNKLHCNLAPKHTKVLTAIAFKTKTQFICIEVNNLTLYVWIIEFFLVLLEALFF